MSGELSILVNQLLMFMTAIGLGFFGYRLRVITDIIADSLSSFVVKFMIPIMLVYIIVEDGTPEGILSALPVMGASFLLVMILLGLGIISASFMDLDIKERAAHICMIGFSNSAFFGFPIFRAMYPAKSANFIATFMLVDALTLWTIAPSILSGEKRINWKKMVNGATIAAFIGIGMVFLRIKPVDTIPWDAFRGIGQACKYIAMVYIGADLARKGIKDILQYPQALTVIPVKLLVAPFFVFVVMNSIFGGLIEIEYIMMLTILAGLPSMMTVVMIAKNNQCADGYATSALLTNTVVSMVTLPVVIGLIEFFYF
ncbi:MAG: AEC family transporter [Clostridiales bacterium]|nr:AEC family transporter [Clostridiales bacterium]